MATKPEQTQETPNPSTEETTTPVESNATPEVASTTPDPGVSTPATETLEPEKQPEPTDKKEEPQQPDVITDAAATLPDTEGSKLSKKAITAAIKNKLANMNTPQDKSVFFEGTWQPIKDVVRTYAERGLINHFNENYFTLDVH